MHQLQVSDRTRPVVCAIRNGDSVPLWRVYGRPGNSPGRRGQTSVPLILRRAKGH